MARIISFVLLSLALSLSSSVFAGENATPRVVVVETNDAPAYVTELKQGSKLLNKVDSKFVMRAWRGTFAGNATGAVVVALEYPGSFGDFAQAWDKALADSSIANWLAGLSGLRKIISDSLYEEMPL